MGVEWHRDCSRVARMVTSPISATVSRSVWNFKSHAQTFVEEFPQLTVSSRPDVSASCFQYSAGLFFLVSMFLCRS